MPITSFKAVAKYSDNEKSNFNRDLIDMILQNELTLACTHGAEVNQSITALNRPGHSCQPNSSNQSNGTYKQTPKTQEAQQAYDEALNIKQFSSGKCERLLTLPIRNQELDQNARIVDILKHQRTEFMMCLEFDISDPTFEHNVAPLN